MQIQASHDPIQAFFLSRDAAARRIAPKTTTGSVDLFAGKALTPPTRQSDPVAAATSANGPTKGQRLDLIA
ncbi:MAG TPA: hypothetical protein PKO15_00425 [Fibrobacteria bacterium]|nr:hypothetical protein [Fibrobacteria bacterium]HOX52450.1 hypothetical protein [Fibrobacteria bacterium]